MAGADSTVLGRHSVRLGHEQEEEDNDDADKRARRGSDSEGGEKGAAVCGFGWVGPLCGARKKSWARGLMRPSGSLGFGIGRKKTGQGSWAFGPKVENGKVFYFLFFFQYF
jgi:hypothetical protein